MSGKIDIDAFWALQELGNPRAAVARLVEQGYAEAAADTAIAAVVADAKWEIRKKGVLYLAIGVALGLVAPIFFLVTKRIEVRTATISAVGACVAIYGLVQIIFAVGHTVETASP